MRVLAASVAAGGNGSPTVAILRELADRGHDVRVLGSASQRAMFEDEGLRMIPWSSVKAWEPRVPEPGLRSMLAWLPLATDPGYGHDLQAALKSELADVLLVDCMIPVALRPARRTGVPVALLLHTFSGYWRDQWSTRTPMGWWLRMAGAHPSRLDAVPDLSLLTTLPELDSLNPPDSALAASLVQTGPVLPDVHRPATLGATAPVLVSLSTISYPGQLALLQRVMDAVAVMAIRAVATVTGVVDATALRVPANVEVIDFIPHVELLPTVRAVVSHGGHGTTMLALAHDLPVLTLPLSRHADHARVGEAVVAAGAGLILRPRASVSEIRTALTTLLSDAQLRRAAESLGAKLRSCQGAQRAATALEDLAAHTAGR